MLASPKAQEILDRKLDLKVCLVEKAELVITPQVYTFSCLWRSYIHILFRERDLSCRIYSITGRPEVLPVGSPGHLLQRGSWPHSHVLPRATSTGGLLNIPNVSQTDTLSISRRRDNLVKMGQALRSHCITTALLLMKKYA